MPGFVLEPFELFEIRIGFFHGFECFGRDHRNTSGDHTRPACRCRRPADSSWMMTFKVRELEPLLKTSRRAARPADAGPAACAPRIKLATLQNLICLAPSDSVMPVAVRLWRSNRSLSLPVRTRVPCRRNAQYGLRRERVRSQARCSSTIVDSG